MATSLTDFSTLPDGMLRLLLTDLESRYQKRLPKGDMDDLRLVAQRALHDAGPFETIHVRREVMEYGRARVRLAEKRTAPALHLPRCVRCQKLSLYRACPGFIALGRRLNMLERDVETRRQALVGAA